MDVERAKETIIIVLRRVEDEARTLIERCANARADLPFVQTEADLMEYADKHDLEEGFKHIELFVR